MDLFEFAMQQLAPPVVPTCSEARHAARSFLTAWLRRCHYLTPGQLLGSNPRLFEDLDLNTLARLELVGDLETYYEVQIPDEEIAGLATVRDVEGCLCRRFAQAA